MPISYIATGLWVRITPAAGAANEAIIFGHGARSSYRWGGKIIKRPINATLKFYCPPDKVLTDMVPVDIKQKAVYYHAKHRKVHQYLISCTNLSPPGTDSLQEDANETSCDIYTPHQGRNNLNLSGLFSAFYSLGVNYSVIHCVFCRLSVVDRDRVLKGEVSKDKFAYKARER